MKAIGLMLFLPSLAIAEPVQLAVSEPFAYASGSFGATASFGVTDHQAVRVNVARYGGAILDAVAIIAGADETPSRHGKTTDYAVGWVYHPHALWDGFFFGVDALFRSRQKSEDDGDFGVDLTAVHTHEYAARGQIGYSLLLWRHATLAVAVGMSLGYETGTTERTVGDFGGHQMSTTTDVGQRDVQAEGMLRFGYAFDI